MKKKAYIIPGIMVMTVKTQCLMFEGSGTDDVKVDPNEDNTDDDNRSRKTYNCWEEEEEAF